MGRQWVTAGALGAFWKHFSPGLQLRGERGRVLAGAIPRPEAPLSETPLRSAPLASFFGSQACCLLGVAICSAFAGRALFFAISSWLWGFAAATDMSEITPWTRWAMDDRDGAEAYGLLAVVLLQGLSVTACMAILDRLTLRWRAGVAVFLLALALALAWRVPPLPPTSAVYPTVWGAFGFTAAALATTWLFDWARRRSRSRTPTLVALVLLPVCFLPIAYASLADLICILAPALRLQHGIRLSQIYLQYDLLPSLLALAWTSVGGAPIAFSSVVVMSTFYALFVGVYAVARRLLRPQLAAPLLVSLVIVRFYGVLGDIAPQVSPLRLDLWVLPLALVLAVGLRHWSVGLLLGGLCFFSRSIGILYLGAYALAVALDFFALRRGPIASARAPFWRALRELFVAMAPVLGFVLLSGLAVRLAFGSFGSDAVAMYHQLGVGMMRITHASFYWWLLALIGAVAWLAYARRSQLPPRAGEAAIFAVTLALSCSIYFFGRSHEQNLVNTSAPFLFCCFLGLHLAWPGASEPVFLRWMFRAAPWLFVATCAYFYSNLGLIRTTEQVTDVATQNPLIQARSGVPVPNIDCAEVRGAAGDDHVIFFSIRDYWYYQQCKILPRGYYHPLYLALMKKKLAADLKVWLRRGYKLAVPRGGDDAVAGSLGEFLPELPDLDSVETPNFLVYRLRH